jgi:hypothetical protein
MFALVADPLLTPTVFDGSQFAEFVELGDGLVALKTAAGKYVSQVPNEYGRFETRDAAGAYETFGGGVGIGVKTSWTRPYETPPDKMFGYFCIQLPNL